MKHNLAIICLLLGFVYSAQSQSRCQEITPANAERMVEDMNFLASDNLAGRYPGTEGAAQASNFIMEAFSGLELSPVLKERFYQSFNIPLNVAVDSNRTFLVVKKDTLNLKTDFYPVSYSANGKVNGETVYVKYAIQADDLKHNDLDKKDLNGKIAIINISSPDGIHPHSKYIKYHSLTDRIDAVKKKGAIGAILIDPEHTARPPQIKFKKYNTNGSFPVVFVANKRWTKKLKKSREVSVSVDVHEKGTEGINVVGYLNNGAKTTVLIGAHYDHLGYGAENSLFKAGADGLQIHNGADDNASGTVGLLLLARELTQKRELYNKHNYLFIAFSGEEMGLLGSNYFADNIPEDAGRINYMLNMDMIGRLSERTLEVNGTGTSPYWNEILDQLSCDLEIQKSPSGTGPSDHTSFYYKDIPVLHFFTGTHGDYHKPSDDAEKINFQGMESVLSYILGIIKATQVYPKLEFSSTKEESSMNAPRFNVTLGILPDYMYQERGVRVDGVTEGKPASKAGLKAGDVILKLGDIATDDMMMYMQALGAFKPGDKTTVTYKRGDNTESAPLKF